LQLQRSQFKTPRSIFAAFFILCSSLALSASAAADTFVTASPAEPSNLIPLLATDSASHAVAARIFNGLVRYNPSLELEGELAESWEILDGGITIVFHLRKDVRWQDGRPFTSADVAFTYAKLTDPELPTPYGGDFEKVAKLETPDDFTVRVTYKEPFSPGLASWGMSMLPRHLLENENLMNTRFSRHPVGTGPYRFGRWIAGDRVELYANKDYFEGRPKIDRVVIRVVPDAATTFLELHQESVDMTDLTPLQYTRLTDGEFFKKTYQKYRYPSFGYTFAAFNLDSPLFTDVRVRRGLDAAVNRREIIDGVLMGLGREVTGPFSPDSWAYNSDAPSSLFDPAAARSLLEEAGWRDADGDGVREKDGRRFEFTIVTNQGVIQRQMIAEILQRRFADVGIKMSIKIMEWGSFLKDVVDARKFDMVLLSWGLSRDPDPYDIWHSSKQKPGEFNFIGYSNPEADRLMIEGRLTFDQDARQKIYRRIHELIAGDRPYLFLYVADALPVVHSRFRNVDVSPLGMGYRFVDWDVAPEDVKYTRFEAE
jgi:peptide/nickel transport system substrate-binding protein